MSRAMSALSFSTAWPLAGISRYLAAFWAEVTRDAVRPYRPELHYMRGPGPAWHAKHGKRA
jgi:hypothetical protein